MLSDFYILLPDAKGEACLILDQVEEIVSMADTRGAVVGGRLAIQKRLEKKAKPYQFTTALVDRNGVLLGFLRLQAAARSGTFEDFPGLNAFDANVWVKDNTLEIAAFGFRGMINRSFNQMDEKKVLSISARDQKFWLNKLVKHSYELFAELEVDRCLVMVSGAQRKLFEDAGVLYREITDVESDVPGCKLLGLLARQNPTEIADEKSWTPLEDQRDFVVEQTGDWSVMREVSSHNRYAYNQTEPASEADKPKLSSKWFEKIIEKPTDVHLEQRSAADKSDTPKVIAYDDR